MSFMSAFSPEKSLTEMSDKEFQDYIEKQSKTNNRLSFLDKATGTNFINDNTNSSSSSISGSSALGSFLNSSSLDSITNRAKDMAQFRLGLDKDQATFYGGLRETEAKNNFGRTTSFEDQQQRGRVDLTNIQQNALTGRLERELSNRLTQQQKGFDQSNLQTNRAISLASRRLGQ
jgi:hypothetical protein